jgi:general secretion pathway protein A
MTGGELYTGFFGLSERPFTLTPDPSFLFWSKQHQRAFAVLEYGLMARTPITLITGEIGSGKTTILRAFLKDIDPEITVGLISNAQGGRGELIQWILNALSIPVEPGSSYVSMFQLLQETLVSEYAAGRRVVLIFDEAQNLSIEGLEELRMLTNINSDKDELVQLVLVGQPELRDMVKSPRMKQLAQRVTASFHLQPLEKKAVTDYISHRLQVAGGTGKEISRPAAELIHQASGGVPRLVNQLCEFALLYAWAAEKKTVSVATVRGVLNDGVSFSVEAAPLVLGVQFSKGSAAE